MPEDAATLNRHYGRPNLATDILATLQAAGKDMGALTRDDLAAFEEIHIGGRAATRELAALAGLPKGARVLDVGCGVGGPARTLAAEYGLRVVGVDLTEAFVDAAEALTEVTRVEPAPEFRVADATQLPFPDGAFDGAFLQHVSMNIRDKPRLFAEVRRVLQPGGVLALHEICGGPAGGEPHYPVVWAKGPETSFMVPADALREAVRGAGFTEKAWEDLSGESAAWFREVTTMRNAAGDAPPPGLELVVGPDWPQKRANALRSLEEGRIAVVRGRFERA
ncbi:MAG TPA: class I SAM-dependent methyltransferase [Candidatus Thermoplasmatota archaeon]